MTVAIYQTLLDVPPNLNPYYSLMERLRRTTANGYRFFGGRTAVTNGILFGIEVTSVVHINFVEMLKEWGQRRIGVLSLMSVVWNGR